MEVIILIEWKNGPILPKTDHNQLNILNFTQHATML